jgi:hypothetical protein
MSLYYPPLDLDATISVFDLNMNRLQRRFERKGIQLLIKKSNIIAYATLHWNTYPGARWNGRQIRNACQTALALAEFEAQGGNHEAIIDPNAVVSLEVKHFDTVANTYLGFMNYLKDIYGVNLDERAKENFVRAGVRNSQVTSPPNPLSPRRHDPEPSFRQTFDRRPRVWNPLNSSAQGSGLSRPFQPSYSQLGETPFPTNIVRPTMHTQYPQNQAYMQQTPASEFNQSSFAADILQNASYLNSLPGGFTQTAGQAQQTLQRPQVQQVQQSQHQPMASQQAAGPGVQPNPFAAARPNDQYPNYPTASNVWTQNSGLMSTDSTEPGSSQSTNINTTQRRP